MNELLGCTKCGRGLKGILRFSSLGSFCSATCAGTTRTDEELEAAWQRGDIPNGERPPIKLTENSTLVDLERWIEEKAIEAKTFIENRYIQTTNLCRRDLRSITLVTRLKEAIISEVYRRATR